MIHCGNEYTYNLWVVRLFCEVPLILWGVMCLFCGIYELIERIRKRLKNKLT